MTSWILRDDPLERVQPLVGFLVVPRGLARLRHQVEELNLVLGIGEAGAIGRERGHERADVAERGEPGARVGIDFDRRLRRGAAVADMRCSSAISSWFIRSPSACRSG